MVARSGASAPQVSQARGLPLQDPYGKICPHGAALFVLEGFPEPMAHLHSPSTPMPPLLVVQPHMSHPYTCAWSLFLCRCPKPASADTLGWAELRW